MDRQLSLEVVRITEQAALRSAHLVGLGDKEGADPVSYTHLTLPTKA